MTHYTKLIFTAANIKIDTICQTVPEAAKASALLQCLSKHLIFADVIITDGATGESHCLLKVILPDLWHRIILFHLLEMINMQIN